MSQYALHLENNKMIKIIKNNKMSQYALHLENNKMIKIIKK